MIFHFQATTSSRKNAFHRCPLQMWVVWEKEHKHMCVDRRQDSIGLTIRSYKLQVYATPRNNAK